MQDKKRISQAFVKFTAALKNFERTMKLPEDNEDYRNSAILSFLLTQETAWKAIKWLLKEEIAIEANGPKTVIQEAFLQGWLGTDSDIWFDMTQDRNLIAHTYNAEDAKEIYQKMKNYIVALRDLNNFLTNKYQYLK